MMHPERFIAWVLENAVTASVSELVVKDVREAAHKVNETVNAIANDAVSKQFVQVIERSCVNLIEREISLS